MDPDPDASSASILYQAQRLVNDIFSSEESLTIGIGILVAIWLVTGLLASYASALNSLNGSYRERLTEKNDSSSQRLLQLIDDKNVLLLTLRGIVVLFNVTFSILAFEALYTIPLARSMNAGLVLFLYIPPICLVLVTASRVIPRFIALRYPLVFCQTLSVYFFLLHKIFSPISRPAARWLQKTLSYGRPAPQYLSGEDLKAMADMGEAHGTIEEDERELIHSIVDFGDTAVREVMVSRLDMQVISTADTLSEALDLIQRSGHSRLPLYEQHLDNILGVIYVKDLLPYFATPDGANRLEWRRIAREALFVPASKPLDDLLRVFQARKMHLAIVVDEYGGTAGMVTMEDLLEEIVGDIRDEFDEAEEDLHVQIDEFTHVFDARIHLEDLCEVLNIELDIEKYDFDTLGGLIFHLTGQIPVVGDCLTYENMTMRIESIHNHRIGHVRVSVKPPTEDKSMVA